jgi:hypothetical protein
VLEPVMDWLSARSRQAYVALLEREGFLMFFRQATPIDVIEESRIGSRPARRTGAPSLADLRHPVGVQLESGASICRDGLASAVRYPRSTEMPGAIQEVAAHLQTWAPLHYALSNAATSLAAADLDVMREARRSSKTVVSAGLFSTRLPLSSGDATHAGARVWRRPRRSPAGDSRQPRTESGPASAASRADCAAARLAESEGNRRSSPRRC